MLALVTSHYTLDKQNAAIREYLADKADFLGAIRLPSDAFKREGTAVVTDIVFLRKRAPGEPAHHVDPDWLGIAPLAIDGAEVPVNRYFLNHPEMVLGNWSRKDTLYGGEGFSVDRNGDLQQPTRASHWPSAEIRARPRFRRKPTGDRLHRPLSRRRPSGISARAASSSATTSVIHQIARRSGRARRLWRQDAEGRRHHDRQTAGRPD